MFPKENYSSIECENQMCKDGREMRLAVKKGTQQSWRRHRYAFGKAILLPLSLDTRQRTLQAQLHSYLENLDQQWFNALRLLLYLYVKKHNNFVTNKQYFLSY